jgi:hypothetical protein
MASMPHPDPAALEDRLYTKPEVLALMAEAGMCVHDAILGADAAREAASLAAPPRRRRHLSAVPS